ncbi:unnamed protein product, partial [Rotaria sordida]
MWGANVAATFEQVVENHDQVQTVEGSLSVVLKSLPISGEAKLDLQNKDSSKLENLQISFSSDLLIDECPQNIEQVLSIFKKVPSLIKPLNNGKGQQLVFFLYPLKRIAQIFKHELRITRIINEVSHLVVLRIENIFEDISKGKRKFNDFLNEIKPWEDYISHDWQNEIRQKQDTLSAVELKTQRELKTLLENIRGGQEQEFIMERLLDNFDSENPCSLRSIENFLRDKRNITLKIGTLKDFDREKQKLSHKQISSILKENSSPSEKEIVNWHKAFMDEHPTGELTEDDFISELTKLYKNGNATHYADFVFTATDKDRSGTISFCEFMSAVALTSKGNAENVEKRLGLIFHVIVGNSKRGAEFQGLVKFIEAVTTLVKGEDAVNTSDIKGIVKQMFKICKKDADDGDLSKEEFINCCLWQKGKIGCAFLPDIP